MDISSAWSQVVGLISLTATHVSEGLCIRPKPMTVPVKMCVRNAIEGSLCCRRHQEDCPVPTKGK